MRLRAQIIIDVEVEDFAGAAVHQTRLEELYDLVRGQYEQATFEFRQRRLRVVNGNAPTGMQHYTGRMSTYRE